MQLYLHELTLVIDQYPLTFLLLLHVLVFVLLDELVVVFAAWASKRMPATTTSA